MADTLVVHIMSFSYRDPPVLRDGHDGGGFVFDCRCLPNPGRQDQYKALTGRDASVCDYLTACAQVGDFFNHVCALVDQAVKNYQERGFVSLYVWFGCTGGQHRSVFLAERLQTYLNAQGVKSLVRHRNLEAMGRTE